MPRPRKGQVRDQHLTLRLTLEESLALRERAARSGQSLGHYVRSAALAARPQRSPIVFALEPASFWQIRMLGVNLNQIAKRLNSLDIPAPPELAPLLASIHAALSKGLPAS